MAEFSESIQISASINDVWATLADIGSISDWNPGVKASHQTSDGEVCKGASRHCNLGGRDYLEEDVVAFEPPTKITFRISETNLPFESADIRFTLKDAEGGTTVNVSPLYRLKFGVLGKLLNVLMVKPAYRKGMRDLLRGLKAHVETTAP